MPNAIQTNISITWASDGAIIDPDATLGDGANYKEGWLSEIPTRQEFNFVLNAIDNNVLYMVEHGRYSYDSDVDYGEGASVHQAGRIFYSKSNVTAAAPLADSFAKWVMGWSFGDTKMADYLNPQGLLLSNIGGFTSGTLWEGNDLHIKSAIPTISFECTGTSDNWLLANVEGEMCAINKVAITLPNNQSIAKSQSDVHRLFHEGHTPTQSEVSGTIPDAPNNATGYVRKGAAWVAENTGLADAPSDGKQYARKDAAWAEVQEGPQAGDVIESILSKSAMLTRGYLRMDGYEVNRTTYATLYAIPEMGDLWGDGNGVDTFNTPRIPPRDIHHRRWINEPDMANTPVTAIAVYQSNETIYVLVSKTNTTTVGEATLWRKLVTEDVFTQFADLEDYDSGAVCMDVDQDTGDLYIGYTFSKGIRRIVEGTTTAVYISGTTAIGDVACIGYNTNNDTLNIGNWSSTGSDYYRWSVSGGLLGTNNGTNFRAMTWCKDNNTMYATSYNKQLYLCSDSLNWSVVPSQSGEANTVYTIRPTTLTVWAMAYDPITQQIIMVDNISDFTLTYDINTRYFERREVNNKVGTYITGLAFVNNNGDMYAAQRGNTNGVLRKLRGNKYGPEIWSYIKY